ncbi:hypothetical protein BU24DRAFT_205893 [Aaosphaeria arxii CBS 175.79]|uniref:CID domain-containing protein n=1 Tax=Aaosphaeria arxii CBS 175.79 TaxID=1450172 RepID=A0A6A5XUI3_9PLEO|nr:uncharacterized protein BU24DRAFT_205893 [Aaosphaeria arxii CBS 175.79]KAF2016586.1 hypothetical protein BU24DRAFT_205893 [Aaosphaeria arxii CBS 175.79]
MDYSSEVADDFREALKDLKTNSRPEINTLTIIARENTEHAQVIARELENHIRTTHPSYKLPALYVLDSIVKNVGTPYTVYFGLNLYRTFMDAYSLTDAGTRKAMETLLRTWKLPMPDSVDSRPVFSQEVTRDIENALIKLRTVAVQQQAHAQQQSSRHGLPPKPPMPNNGGWPNTPTPPPQQQRNFPTPPPPQANGYPPPPPQQQTTFSPLPQQQSSFPTPNTQQTGFQLPPNFPQIPGFQLPPNFNFAQFQPPPPPIPTPPVPAPAPAYSQQPPPTVNLAALLAQLQSAATPTPAPALAPTPTPAPQPQQIAASVELTTSSMKIPRPQLINKLYAPNMCLTCGRRFENTVEGKQKKSDHMDWHFRVKNSLASSRGVHRTWYLTEKEWIVYREFDEALNETPTEVKPASGADKKRYVPAPPGLTSCPICLDEFKPTWNAEANDFVFMDAVEVNKKIYHVSCWEEVNGGPYIPTPGTPNSTASTKRKADAQDWHSGKRPNWG